MTANKLALEMFKAESDIIKAQETINKLKQWNKDFPSNTLDSSIIHAEVRVIDLLSSMNVIRHKLSEVINFIEKNKDV